MNEATNNQLQQIDDEFEVTAEQVATYLSEHVDFFETQTELLKQLSIPHCADTRSSPQPAVSLIERQVTTLRDENARLKQQLNTLIANARDNDELFDKTRQLALHLLSATTTDQVISTTENAMIQDFGGAYCRLWLVTETTGEQCTSHLSRADATDKLQRLVEQKRPYCGLLKAEESEYLYREQASQIGSAAVLPLYRDERLIAVLTIASEDKGYYRNNMSTTLLSYIGDIVAAIVQNTG